MLVILATLLSAAIGYGIYEWIDGDSSNDNDDDNGGARDNGSNAPDLIKGSNGDDDINGAGGHDSIFGGAGDDLIKGGHGKDLIEGQDGSDTIDGQDWHDTIGGGAGDDSLEGAGGKDWLLGNAGDDQLSGGAWHDNLIGGDGSDTLNGGAGDDYLAGGYMDPLDQTSTGDTGIDFSAEALAVAEKYLQDTPDLADNITNEMLIKLLSDEGYIVPGTETALVENGADRLEGGSGNDEINLGANDTGVGGEGSDAFTLSPGHDGAPAVIEDYVIGQDGISIQLKESETETSADPEFRDDGKDLIVSYEGTDLVRVLNMAGRSGELTIFPTYVPNIDR